MTIALDLLIGLIGASAFIAFARRAGHSKVIFGVGLIIAALIYVGFAFGAADRPRWLVIELFGVAAYSAFALLGIRGSAWWLAAGWLLHPVWDVAIHFVGTGAAFTPAWYAIGCMSFDVLVAAYIATSLARRNEKGGQGPPFSVH